MLLASYHITICVNQVKITKFNLKTWDYFCLVFIGYKGMIFALTDICLGHHFLLDDLRCQSYYSVTLHLVCTSCWFGDAVFVSALLH